MVPNHALKSNQLLSLVSQIFVSFISQLTFIAIYSSNFSTKNSKFYLVRFNLDWVTAISHIKDIKRPIPNEKKPDQVKVIYQLYYQNRARVLNETRGEPRYVNYWLELCRIRFWKITYFLQRFLMKHIDMKISLGSKLQIYSTFSIRTLSRN